VNAVAATLAAPQLELTFAVRRRDFSLAVDLALPGRCVTALFGHSGSGKTTFLRVLAGLERPAAGARVVVNGETWHDDGSGVCVPTHRRPLGVVFQEASLFPHLSAHANLVFGLNRLASGERRVSLEQAVDLLGIGHLLDRSPVTLSGGERQRVAIARALLTSPKLLLMDEPLASLDGKRKQEILPYLERLHRELDIPVLYVSHSPDEVARLADHVVLLDAGRVVAHGPLGETLARLDLPPVFADDAGVVIESRLTAQEDEDHLSRLDFPGGTLYVTRHAVPLGSPVRCRVHARDVSLSLAPLEGSSILNRFPAIVRGLADTDNPAQVLVRLDVGSTPLLARVTRRSARQLALVPGLALWAQVKAVALL
jgi:molybdate transport system ATP-binding protein